MKKGLFLQPSLNLFTLTKSSWNFLCLCFCMCHYHYNKSHGNSWHIFGWTICIFLLYVGNGMKMWTSGEFLRLVAPNSWNKLEGKSAKVQLIQVFVQFHSSYICCATNNDPLLIFHTYKDPPPTEYKGAVTKKPHGRRFGSKPSGTYLSVRLKVKK